MGQDLVGGQALVDGVMVRQGEVWSAAVRRADGSIVTTTETTVPALAPIRGVPFIRGIGALVDSIRIGMGAMRWSRSVSEAGTGEVAAGPTPFRERIVVAGVVTGVVAGFLLIPLVIAWAAGPLVGEGLGASATEGVARLGMFVAYLALISRLPGIRRTLEYHGAEHMVIAAYEHSEPPTIASARRYSPRHPRCGTDFFLLIFVLSIVAFALVGELPAVWLVVSRIVLAPVVVGVAYEVLRAGGTSSHAGLASVLSGPGLWLQRFTTREPTDDQIEVALEALSTLQAHFLRRNQMICPTVDKMISSQLN